MKKLIISVFFLVLIPVISFSHVHVLGMDPSPGSVLTEPPRKVTITFAGSVEPAFSRIEVFDQNEKKVSKKTKGLEDDTVLVTELLEDLSPGEYTVKCKVISMDGHKKKAEYTFSIK